MAEGLGFDGSDAQGQGEGEYMGSCQNYGPFLGTLNIRCRRKEGPKEGP